jgi:hypothetical protein
MKYITVTLFLIASAITDNLDASKMSDDLNKAVLAADQAEADEKNRLAMEKFEKDMHDAVLAHRNSIKKIEVGNFHMMVQDNCKLVLPEKPDYVTVTEKECLKAVFNATTTAQLVAKATPLNPPSIKMVINAVNSCELKVQWVKEFEIYNECWGEEVPAKYQHILGPQIEKLEQQGYVRDEETGRWVKKGEGKTISLESEGGNQNNYTLN